MNQRSLKYEHVTFRKSGNSRFIVIYDVVPGWNQIQGVPKLIDVSSISIVDLKSRFFIKTKAFRNYDDILTPSLPTEVEVERPSNMDPGLIYKGLLVKKDPQVVSLLTEEGLIEVTAPYILSYKNCGKEYCRSMVPRVNIEFISELKTSEPLRLGFEAEGFSWDASYKTIVDFNNRVLSELNCEISCINQTELSLENVKVSFMSKSDENNRQIVRSAQAMMASPRFSSEQTSAGSTLYHLNDLVNVPERSTSIFNFFRLINIPVDIDIKFNILEQPKHPKTFVRFRVPKQLVDGIPSGMIQCWENKTWLNNSYIPMSAPNDLIILNLGENAFIKLTINVHETPLKDNQTSIEEVLYRIHVRIDNNSSGPIKIVPYQLISGGARDIKSDIKYRIIDDDIGNRIEFNEIPVLVLIKILSFSIQLL